MVCGIVESNDKFESNYKDIKKVEKNEALVGRHTNFAMLQLL